MQGLHPWWLLKMIRLSRGIEPQALTNNKVVWLQYLEAALTKYGSYKDIPEAEKQKLVSHYRHDEIKNALIASSNGKCAFCECIPSEGGNVEVEHFRPKSIYPKHTFDWSNLLPACRKCNGTKLDHDTIAEPIINPYDYDPESLFYYDDIEMKVQECPDKQLGLKTIEICGLNSVRLYRPRANILISLRVFSQDLEMAINEYKNAGTARIKGKRFRNLGEAIEKIEMLASPQEKYSNFCSHFLKNCSPYIEAKAILSSS